MSKEYNSDYNGWDDETWDDKDWDDDSVEDRCKPDNFSEREAGKNAIYYYVSPDKKFSNRKELSPTQDIKDCERTIEDTQEGSLILLVLSGIFAYGSYEINKSMAKASYIAEHIDEYNSVMAEKLSPIVNGINEKYNLQLTPTDNILSQMYDTLSWYYRATQPGFADFRDNYQSYTMQISNILTDIENNFIDWVQLNQQIVYNTVFSTVIAMTIAYTPVILIYAASKIKLRKLQKQLKKEQEQGK